MNNLTADEIKEMIRAKIKRDSQIGVHKAFWDRLFWITWGI